MYEIIDRLYLSNYAFAKNNDICELGITHIINLSQIPNKHLVESLEININDIEDENISKYFRKTSVFIYNALENPNNKVLVYCLAGISRSPTIIIAFLIKKKHMSFNEADTLVRNKKPNVQPNPGFYDQLSKIKH